MRKSEDSKEGTSCDSCDTNQSMENAIRQYEYYRKNTICLNCPSNNHHDYPIMGGHITASICEACGEWLDPKDYRSTIYEMGCEV